MKGKETVWTHAKDKIIVYSRTAAEASRKLKINAKAVKRRRNLLFGEGHSLKCEACNESFWRPDGTKRKICPACHPGGTMPDYLRKRMRDGRRRALESGKYDQEYQRKRDDQQGLAHGNNEAISEGHLKHGEFHPLSKDHDLTDPEGNRHKFQNVDNFVRSNKDLFLDVDVILRKKPNGKSYSRAAAGLLAVSNGNKKSWKGWIKT